MTGSYDLRQWSDFFTAAAGAAAALSGLIFVGVSVNLDRILALDKGSGSTLVLRGLEALVVLIEVLLISLVALAPSISSAGFAIVVLVAAAATLAFPARTLQLARRAGHNAGLIVPRVALGMLCAAALAVTGVTVLVGEGGGITWIVAAYIFAVLSSGLNAWVLLVEIQR